MAASGMSTWTLKKNMQTGLSDYRKLSTTPKSRFGKLIEYGSQKINRLPEPRAARMRAAQFVDLRASCVGALLAQEGTRGPSFPGVSSYRSVRRACHVGQPQDRGARNSPLNMSRAISLLVNWNDFLIDRNSFKRFVLSTVLWRLNG